jgi:hypothetical protein
VAVDLSRGRVHHPRPEYLRTEQGKHVVFFRRDASGETLIVRILHERMLPELHLTTEPTSRSSTNALRTKYARTNVNQYFVEADVTPARTRRRGGRRPAENGGVDASEFECVYWYGS